MNAARGASLVMIACLLGQAAASHVGSFRIAVVLNAIAVVAGLVTMTAIVGRARRGVGSLLDRAEYGLQAVVPPLAAAVVVGEFRMARGLALAMLRRIDRRSPDDVPIPYATGRALLPGVFFVVSLIELVAVDLLVPWHRLGPAYGLRWVVLIISIYGLIWLAAWHAGERSHPHLATRDGLVLRTGALVVAAEIPWGQIESVALNNRFVPDDARVTLDAPMVTPGLDIDLNAPVPTRRFWRRGPDSAAFSLAVDDSAAALAVIQERLPGRRIDPVPGRAR